MKLRNFFYLLLALPLFIAGCTESNTDEPTPKEVKLELTSEASLSFEAEGGNGTIAYVLENAVEGVGLSATCEANWVSDITLGDKITFVVAPNEGEARDTKIVVSYQDKSFEVAVNQKACEVVTNVYYMDDTLVYGERISLAAYGYPNNYFYLGFLNEAGSLILSGILVGAESDSILAAGTYTAADENALVDTFGIIFSDESELYFEDGDATVVVEGDINGYAIDILLTDAKGLVYHFTFEGVIENMEPQGGLPTEPVNITLDTFNGEYYGTQYSPTYNYYVVLSDKGLDADGYAQAGGTYYQIDLYGGESEVDADGYIAIPEGTYTFDADDTMAEWTMGNYYSGYAKVNASGTGYDASAAFEGGQAVVTANGITLTVLIGGVEHTVTYTGAPKIYVGVPADDVEFEAQYAYAYYFGDYYTPGYADNYYFFLSDLGLDEEGYEMANGTYYRFDIYAPIGDGTKIPAGTYTIDMTDSGSLWTASLSYSAWYILDEYGWDYAANDYPASGTIVVGEDGSITAEVTMLMSGTTHIVTYNGGDITIYDASEGEGGEGGGTYSTLESDWNCNLSDHTLYYEAYGDWYEVGYQNWVIAIMPNTQEGDFVQFDILGGTDSSSFAGEYTISDSLGSYTAYPGYVDEGYMSGGWYYTEDGYTMAPFVDGSLDITDIGDGKFSVEFDVYDDCDYNITGKWTGEIRPASELMQATRSGSLKQYKSVVIDETVAPKNIVKEPLVAKRAKQNVTAAKGLKLR